MINFSFFNSIKTYVSGYGKTAVKETKKVATETDKRLKFVEDFNKKYERKRVDGDNGAFSKYVIDRENGRIVQFFRRNEKGEKMSGDLSYEFCGRHKDICLISPKKDIHRETVYLPYGGRNVITYNIENNNTVITNVTTDAKGKTIEQSEMVLDFLS